MWSLLEPYCQILAKIVMCRQILVKLPYNKSNKKPFSDYSALRGDEQAYMRSKANRRIRAKFI